MSHWNNKFLSSLLLVVCLPLHTSGFAAWLKCYVDLLDDDEVIMNHGIVPARDAYHKGVEIEVKFSQDDDWSTTFTYPDHKTSFVTARLKVPPELASEDVQYVIDTVYDDPEGTMTAAKFKPPFAVCDGRRAHAKYYHEAVVLEIDGTSNTDQVHLVAGYAMHHGPVTLTPVLVLHRQQLAMGVEL